MKEEYTADRCKPRDSFHRTTLLLLICITAGLVLSIMAKFDICTGACSDTHSYVIFGMDLGWFGIAFFSCAFVLCTLRSRSIFAANIFPLLIFAAAGAEINFIQVQKYEPQIWCPICLSIAAVLLFAVFLLLYERATHSGFNGNCIKRNVFIGIAAFALGFFCAFFGMKQETFLPPGLHALNLKPRLNHLS